MDCAPSREPRADHDDGSRALRGLVAGGLLGVGCWTVIALAVFYRPARQLAEELWPLGLIVAANLATHLQPRRDRYFWAAPESGSGRQSAHNRE